MASRKQVRSRKDNAKYQEGMKRLREAKALFSKDMLNNPDVHGLGIGYQIKDGKKTNVLAIVVHVYKKLARKDVSKIRMIPSKLTFFSPREGREVSVPVDVREAIPPRPEVDCGDCDQDFGARVRPVPGGFSFGLATVPGGTFGGCVWDNETERIVLLSNEHVLGSTAGDAVIQPSIGDGGSFPDDHIADVVRAGTLDVSIAAPISGDQVLVEIECSGPAVFEIAAAELEMEIEKVGQTTGLTCGLIELIDYDSNHHGSHNDLWISGDGSNFSEPGDSGSLYVEKQHPEGRDWKRVVGIHWGGSGNDGIGHPITAVFDDLNLTTVCAGLMASLIEAITSSESEEAEATSGLHILGARRTKQGAKRAFNKGLARDFERRIGGSKTGKTIIDLIQKHRVDIVAFLMDGDGLRSSVAALRPILGNSVTTDDVLDHRISDADLANFKRVLETAKRLRPEMKNVFFLADKLLNTASGKTLRSILLS